MPLDLPHAASRIDFARPIPAISQEYGCAPPVPWLAAFSENFEMGVSAERTIDGFGAMHENWDGYGAAPIPDEVIRNAKAALWLIRYAAPTPDVTPNPNGTVSFEWESDRGTAQLEIGKTRLSFYLAGRGKPVFFVATTQDLISVCRWVDQMVSNYLYPPQALSLSAIQIGMHAYGRASTRY